MKTCFRIPIRLHNIKIKSVCRASNNTKYKCSEIDRYMVSFTGLSCLSYCRSGYNKYRSRSVGKLI